MPNDRQACRLANACLHILVKILGRQRSVQVLSTTAESNHFNQHNARYITDITKGSAAEIYGIVAVLQTAQNTVYTARLVPGWVTVFGRVYHLGM